MNNDQITFKDLSILPSILQALEDQNYMIPTPIQAQGIPAMMSGKDLLGCAQTGTGKTAAFAIPILQKIGKDRFEVNPSPKIQSLILAPTRELAIQIGESFQKYGKYLPLEVGVIYGGVTPKRHVKVLKRGVDILVATPGRLLDLFSQGYIDFSSVNTFVLDEADRMLDMGMIADVEKIISKLPKARQNVLFSATIPKEISKLIHQILKNPIKIEIEAPAKKKNDVAQFVYFVDDPDKTALLLHLLKNPALESVLVFVRTKGKADRISKAINIANFRSKSIHGDKNQSERVKALEGFKNKEIRILVATDVAARGIDIDKLSHVINYDLPNITETYIHRIGRTGRAGQGGTAISFCSNHEMPYLEAIEKLQGKSLTIEDDNPYVLINVAIKRNREKYAAPVSKPKEGGKQNKNRSSKPNTKPTSKKTFKQPSKPTSKHTR